MKYLIALFLLLPIIGHSQKPLSNAKKIVLTLEQGQTTESTVKQLVAYLTNNGYEIDHYDKDLGLLTTKEKDIKFWQMRLSIYLEENKIKISGKAFGSALGVSSSWDVENKGSMGSVFVHTWREMNTIALGFPHSSIEYLK